MQSNTSRPSTQHNEPVVAFGYSGGIGGAVRAIEHLARIAVETGMVPRPTVAVRRS
jgi:NAD(P)H-dependent FMN reductase